MELSHYEYQHEEWQYLQQKERKEDEKLQTVMQYTQSTFRQFDFSEEEIFQICECVRYFVTNRQALSVNIHVKRQHCRYLNLTKELRLEHCFSIQH